MTRPRAAWRHRAMVVVAACALAACGGAEVEADPLANTVTISFTLPEGVRSNPNLVDPPQGTVYGQLFRYAEVSVTGPKDGAEPFDDVEVDIDLREVDVSAETWTSGALPADVYVFLGFFDVDGNGADDPDPDNGDPVPLATTNDFTIVDGEATTLVAQFDIVYNFDE